MKMAPYQPMTWANQATTWPKETVPITEFNINQIQEIQTLKATNFEMVGVEGYKRMSTPHWYFVTIVECPACGKRKVTRERRKDERPNDPEDRRKIIQRYCKCSHK